MQKWNFILQPQHFPQKKFPMEKVQYYYSPSTISYAFKPPELQSSPAPKDICMHISVLYVGRCNSIALSLHYSTASQCLSGRTACMCRLKNIIYVDIWHILPRPYETDLRSDQGRIACAERALTDSIGKRCHNYWRKLGLESIRNTRDLFVRSYW